MANVVDRTLALWRVQDGLTPGQQAATYGAIAVGAYGIFEVIRGRMAFGVPALLVGVGGAWYLYSKKRDASERADALREYLQAKARDRAAGVPETATATGWQMGATRAGLGQVVAQSRLDADRRAAESAALRTNA